MNSPQHSATPANDSATRGSPDSVVRGASGPAQPTDRRPPGAAATPESSIPTRKPRPRKLDLQMKEAVCRLVDEGHGLTSAARIVGVSPRTVSREKDRDPLFKRRLHQGREGVARLCHRTMEAAAEEKWQAAERYYKLVYPERYYYKPETMPLKVHDAWNNELFEHLKAIMTDDQMRQLDRALKLRFESRSKPPKKPAA